MNWYFVIFVVLVVTVILFAFKVFGDFGRSIGKSEKEKKKFQDQISGFFSNWSIECSGVIRAISPCGRFEVSPITIRHDLCDYGVEPLLWNLPEWKRKALYLELCEECSIRWGDNFNKVLRRSTL